MEWYKVLEARDIAQKELLGSAGWSQEWLDHCKHTISYRVYDPQKPECRICYKIAKVEDYPLFTSGVMPFGVIVKIDARSGNVLSITELQELDIYDFWCEFPDERDTVQTVPHGLGLLIERGAPHHKAEKSIYKRNIKYAYWYLDIVLQKVNEEVDANWVDTSVSVG